MLIKTSSRYWQIDFCRGMKGNCRFSLTDSHDYIEGLTELVRDSDYMEICEDRDKTPHHRKLKIAFSSCPNACTQPQIKDVGIIAELSPQEILQTCTACGKCLSVCKEQAIRITRYSPRLQKDKCLNCGMCINQCPKKAIRSNPLHFKILIGGRMGRHPRWADHIHTVDQNQLLPLIERILITSKQYLDKNERFANLIEKDGLTKLKESICHV